MIQMDWVQLILEFVESKKLCRCLWNLQCIARNSSMSVRDGVDAL